MSYQTYSDQNPPKGGTAKILFKALKAAGYSIRDLHYNPNNWGRFQEDGWGTWACGISGKHPRPSGEFWCGVLDGVPYLQNMRGAFSAVMIADIAAEAQETTE